MDLHDSGLICCLFHQQTYVRMRFLLLTLVSTFYVVRADPLVQSSLGPIRGLDVQTEAGNAGFAFLGVPYAQPPVGDLRFRPSRLYEEPWDGVRDATQSANDCLQIKAWDDISDQRSEDCLYLNVFTSQRCLDSSDCPVMFYIFGGAFASGGPGSYHPDLLTDHFVSRDVVVVLPNYRLNALASFNTGTPDAPGNLWTYDQGTALAWTLREAANFGGDKNRITVMGDSSGGMDVGFLTLSPKTNWMFQQAVPMSGSGLMPAFTGTTPFTNSSALIALAGGCIGKAEDWDRVEKRGIAECMRRVPSDFFEKYIATTQVAPEIFLSGELFPGTLAELLEARPPMNILAGATGKEFTGYVVPAEKQLKIPDAQDKGEALGNKNWRNATSQRTMALVSICDSTLSFLAVAVCIIALALNPLLLLVLSRSFRSAVKDLLSFK